MIVPVERAKAQLLDACAVIGRMADQGDVSAANLVQELHRMIMRLDEISLSTQPSASSHSMLPA
jgi:hypothetical protein